MKTRRISRVSKINGWRWFRDEIVGWEGGVGDGWRWFRDEIVRWEGMVGDGWRWLEMVGDG